MSFSSKCRLFHNATFFGSCIIHVLHTGCAKKFKKFGCQKVKKENSALVSRRTATHFAIMAVIEFALYYAPWGSVCTVCITCVCTDAAKTVRHRIVCPSLSVQKLELYQQSATQQLHNL
jgi:hypothetical protein